jgi:hypothetical protein
MKPATILAIMLPLWSVNAFATISYVNLGSASPFAVLGGSAVTNTGSSMISGDLGVSPGTSITGFLPGVYTGTLDAGDATAAQAQADLATAYTFAVGEACGTDLTGQALGGMTLTPGSYCFSSSADLTGILTLNAEGDPNAVFLFQIGSTLTTGSNASVLFTNSGQGGSLFWQVGSSATIGSGTAFEGNILADASISLGTDASIGCGRALAINGAVTMDTNNVSIESAGCLSSGPDVPEPATGAMTGVSLLLIAAISAPRLLRRSNQ